MEKRFFALVLCKVHYFYDLGRGLSLLFRELVLLLAHVSEFSMSYQNRTQGAASADWKATNEPPHTSMKDAIEKFGQI